MAEAEKKYSLETLRKAWGAGFKANINNKKQYVTLQDLEDIEDFIWGMSIRIDHSIQILTKNIKQEIERKLLTKIKFSPKNVDDVLEFYFSRKWNAKIEEDLEELGGLFCSKSDLMRIQLKIERSYI